ncbi:MAG: HAD hydrolase-like protein, partial [Acidobacteriota bacterium]|nr:HAD hydrolase-like protein [Acidobacteriota bacterium]
TLVRRTGPYHRTALAVAVREVFSVETTTDGIPVHGMLDPDILRAMLRRAGVSDHAITGAMPELQRFAEQYYLEECPDLQYAACPGVHRLLERLQRKRIPLALVTGNFTRIGWHKLTRAGLAHYFSFGAFAELAQTRAGLAALAIVRVDAGRVYLVGDAPSDIEAARANGIISVSVHTGVSTRDDLAALKPDYLIPSLRFFTLATRIEALQPG